MGVDGTGTAACAIYKAGPVGLGFVQNLPHLEACLALDSFLHLVKVEALLVLDDKGDLLLLRVGLDAGFLYPR